MITKSKVTINPSRILFLYYLFFSGATTLAVFYIDLPFKILLWLYVVIISVVNFYRYFSKKRIKAILWRANGLLDLQSEKTTFKNQKLLPSSRVFSKLIILNFRRHKLIILPDSMDEDAFRRLKVYLRFHL